jgi:hypothetical protein
MLWRRVAGKGGNVLNMLRGGGQARREMPVGRSDGGWWAGRLGKARGVKLSRRARNASGEPSLPGWMTASWEVGGGRCQIWLEDCRAG